MSHIEYYNEANYLGKNNIEAINYINKEKNAYVLDVIKSAKKYGNSIKAYDEYTNFIAYLIKCLGIPKDTLSASMILNLITKKGVFSQNHKIITNGVPHDNVYGFMGINVIHGQAVCRHLSSFQSDVLSKLNLISNPLYVYMSDIDIDNVDCKRANHAINLIEYNDNLYGYDALNNGLFRFISNRKLEELFCDNIHYMYYKPYIHMMFDGMDISGINNFISLFDVIKNKQIISLKEYNDIYDNAVDIVNKNNRLLDDFHASSKKYIKRITMNI